MYAAEVAYVLGELTDGMDMSDCELLQVHRLAPPQVSIQKLPYFAAKATANTAEKAFLLGEGFEFSLKNGVPHLEDKAIFADEASKHYYPKN